MLQGASQVTLLFKEEKMLCVYQLTSPELAGGFVTNGFHLLLGNDHPFRCLFTSCKPIIITPAVLGLVWAFTGGANLFMDQSAPLVLGYSYGYFTAKDLSNRLLFWLFWRAFYSPSL
jgi:hypothetical protein